MTSYEEPRSERDEAAIRRICHVHTSLQAYLETWIHEEIRALRDQALMLQALATTTPGNLAEQLQQVIDDLDQVLSDELQGTCARLKERIDETEGLLYDDPLESLLQIQDSFGGVQNLMRRVLGIRQSLSYLLGQAPATD
jgi:hypothetical protein